MPGKAIVVGSGPGGSTAAMVLAEAGWEVVLFEKGPNYFGDLASPTPATMFSNDELKSEVRGMEDHDTDAEPRTFRRHHDEAEPLLVGEVNHLPSNVGGGTVHWDAKTPRFWDIDFRKTELGDFEGADVIDWPFDYAAIAPYYEELEALIGVAGPPPSELPPFLVDHAPRDAYPMPPGPHQRSSLLGAEGARRIGLHPFAFPMAINSQPYGGRPACNNCGFCSGHGCPIHARVGALAPLQRAMATGNVDLRANSFVRRVTWTGRRATGVDWIDAAGAQQHEGAKLVVMAASAIETARLAHLSGLAENNAWVGRGLMFHWFTDGFGIFLSERIHAYRGRSTTVCVEDFSDPDFPGARAAAALSGLPYFRGGILEIGGSQQPLGEAATYRGILPLLRPEKPFGREFKQLMRASLFRDRLCGLQMIGEDLPQATNTVDLDPSVKDARGVPVARITYSPHRHELAAQRFYLPLITALLKAAGADLAGAVPQTSSDEFPFGGEGDVPSGRHIMGGMRMGASKSVSACDGHGRVHDFDNLLVADASVFPTSGAGNPTLTIMATALRNTRAFA